MRLDAYLLETKYFDSRTKAKQAIERGEIYLDGKKIDKSSFDVSLDIEHKIEWKREEDFVSLGGYKLSKALKDFDFCVKDFIVADIGASTGGFTDCLIKNGAKKVFAIDLNDGLLHEKLRGDLRVVPLIKNAKNLSKEDFNLTLVKQIKDLFRCIEMREAFHGLRRGDGSFHICNGYIRMRQSVSQKREIRAQVIGPIIRYCAA